MTDASLADLLARILGVPAATLHDGTGMSDVETWNSLLHIDLIVTLEERFGIELDADEIAEMRSVGAIRAALARHGVVLR